MKISRTQWNTLFAAQAGWMLDAMDAMLYSFALTTLAQEFALTLEQASRIASAQLFAAAMGGIGFGMLADRIGRKTSLSFTLLLYSLASAGTATTGWLPVSPLWQLIGWRALLGLGMGGEWACGAALVAETWPAEMRGRAIAIMQSGWAIGYIIAALLAAAFLPNWRLLFFLGLFPALLTLWVRRHVPETLDEARKQNPASPLEVFSPAFRQFTLRAGAVAICVLIAYWGCVTWLPGFLASPVARGGAGTAS
ncbi:MAG: MFS transporter [Blastocatellia bacterium]